MDACRHAPPAAYPGTMRAALSPPYLALLQAGFAMPWLLPAMRCALTAPFHPYLPRNARRRYVFCCTFRRFAPPRRYLAPCPEEPGLSSARLRRRQSAPNLGPDSDCPADSHYHPTTKTGIRPHRLARSCGGCAMLRVGAMPGRRQKNSDMHPLPMSQIFVYTHEP